jgi:glycosyltransferase involved in cell wall biosynthesis
VNILFLTPQLPYPPRQGTALRNFHLIKGLAERHTISLLSFLEPGQPAEPTEWGPLVRLCKGIETIPVTPRNLWQRMVDLIRSRQPDMALRLWSRPYAVRLAHRCRAEAFDAVHVEGIELGAYVPLLEGAPNRPLILFDDHNAEYLLQKRAFQTDLRLPGRWFAALYSLVQWQRLRRFEADVCRRADRVVAVSGADRHALQALVPGLRVEVIPNCIDTAAYAPSGDPSVGDVPSFTVLFTGKMDFRPNIDAALWFGREIWPFIKRQRPEATWGIVGKSPHARLDVLRRDPSITILGEVPDIRPYFHAASVYVIPLRVGGGTRFKLLEAMAAGTPVVSTAVGAEGVPVRPEEEVLLADQPVDFAAAALRLIDDQALRERLCAASRILVRNQFDWRTVTPALEHVYSA